jgi:uncharacterized protein
MQLMGQLLKRRAAPAHVMEWLAAEDAKRGPYQPCPCGSGRKFKFCHGNKKPATTFSGVSPEVPTETSS